MNKNFFLNNINIDIPYKYIYARLGFKKDITIIDKEQKEKIDQNIKEAFFRCQKKGVWRIEKILSKDEKVILENNLEFESRSIKKLLKASDSVLFMASTVGNDIVNAIKNEVENKKVSMAAVFDAAASETADALLGWIQSYVSQMLKPKCLTVSKKRFSAGYGDFKLIEQKKIYDLLELNKMDITLTKKYIMKPEKSVTAIAGIQKIC